jgi:hypothetical protein
VIDDLVEGHRQRRIVPLHDHSQRIADQNQGNARCIDHLRGGVVVGGERRNPLATAFHGDDIERRKSMAFHFGNAALPKVTAARFHLPDH